MCTECDVFDNVFRQHPRQIEREKEGCEFFLMSLVFVRTNQVFFAFNKFALLLFAIKEYLSPRMEEAAVHYFVVFVLFMLLATAHDGY